MVQPTSTRRGALLLFIMLFATPVLLFGQVTTGSITGLVTDDSGGALPGVTVTASNLATGATRTVVSTSTGNYTIDLLTPSTYSLSGDLSGFQPAKVARVTVSLGSQTTLNLKMKVGVAETLTVTAAAPIVETTRSEVSSVVNEKAIANLPANGRNFIDFVLTTPGVVRDPRSGDISFAGQRGTNNSLVVDGADTNNTFFGQALGRTGSGRAPYQFSQDAVKEFEVNANSYGAEYGRAAGAVINVITKSGTNDFDGSLFDFYRDKKYRANDYINVINKRAKQPYHYQQYGGSLGGPIIKDRHFFFANYDAQRNSFPNLVVLGSPSGGYPTDTATQAALTNLRGRADSYNQDQNQNVYLLKTDSELLHSSHLSLRYNKQKFVGNNLENGGINSAVEHTGNSNVNTDTFSGVFTTVATSSLYNEVRGQYAKDSEPGLANSTLPEATIRQGGATVLVIGRNSFSPRETTIKRNQLADTVTYVWTNHTLKGGFDWNRDNIFNFFPGNFSGVYTFNSLADFQNGVVGTYLQSFPGAGTSGGTTHPNLTDTSLFLQDEWHLMSSLTLNAGLRYDKQGIEQPPISNPDAQLLAAGLNTGRIHEDGNNIGPRLGFAWTPGNDNRTVLRGGYGIFYGRTTAIMIGTAHSQNGIQVQTINFPAALAPVYPKFFDAIPSGVTLPKPTIYVFAPDFQNPRTEQASLGFERALANDFSVGLSYQYVKGSNLPRSADINIGDSSIVPVKISTGGTVDVKQYSNVRPFSNFQRVIEFQSNGHSKYNGITLDLDKRFSDNWQARLAFTHSKAQDDRPDATIVVPGVDDGREVYDANNIAGDYALADTDVPNRAVLSGVWNVGNYANGMSGVARAFLGGWTLSGIASWQSGQPFSRIVSITGTAGANTPNDLNNDGNRLNDRAPGFVRNSERYPNQFSLDPRITRDIGIFGQLKLQLIAEAFNITNASNVRTIRNTYMSYNIGTNTLTPAAIAPINATAGYGSASASVGPRTYQFAAKILF
jgi:outer membrane receptor protein involved in Fe transport